MTAAARRGAPIAAAGRMSGERPVPSPTAQRQGSPWSCRAAVLLSATTATEADGTTTATGIGTAAGANATAAAATMTARTIGSAHDGRLASLAAGDPTHARYSI